MSRCSKLIQKSVRKFKIYRLSWDAIRHSPVFVLKLIVWAMKIIVQKKEKSKDNILKNVSNFKLRASYMSLEKDSKKKELTTV